jgi:ribosome-associated translation inhibitor RaiA
MNPKQQIMKIQVNTDTHIDGHEALAEDVRATVTSTLNHYAQMVTRVEVHLSDQNGRKTGSNDKRCIMEARLEGHEPIAVTDDSDSLAQAITGAAGKLKRAIDHTLSGPKSMGCP